MPKLELNGQVTPTTIQWQAHLKPEARTIVEFTQVRLPISFQQVWVDYNGCRGLV
jgi:hypothetical protein